MVAREVLSGTFNGLERLDLCVLNVLSCEAASKAGSRPICAITLKLRSTYSWRGPGIGIYRGPLGEQKRTHYQQPV